MGLKKNMSCYFIGSIISKTIAFLLVPIYISSMTTAEYGIVGSMIVIINVLSLIITLGVERSIYRLYHDYNSDIEKKELQGISPYTAKRVMFSYKCIRSKFFIF